MGGEVVVVDNQEVPGRTRASLLRRPLAFGAAASTVLLLAMSVEGLAPQRSESFDGQWVISFDPWFERLATGSAQGRGGAEGRGGRGTQRPGQDVVLELRVAPAGFVSGRATGLGGRRDAPGSHPAHDVEITRGNLKGVTLTFEVWQFDGFHNRLRVTARLAESNLELEFRRDTAVGPDTFKTRARRIK